MTVTIDSVADMTLDNLERVALKGESVRYGPRAMKRIAEAHARFQTYVDTHRDIFIYGITSSSGATAKIHRKPEEMQALRRRNRRGPFVGLSFADRALPDSVVRAALFSRLACWLEGVGSIEPAHAEALTQALDGPLPKVPEQGGIGAGEVVLGQILNAHLPPRSDRSFELGGNRSSFNNGMAGLSAIFARRRLALATQIFALSIEAFKAPLAAYDPALKALWGDEYESEALDALNHWLKGVPTKERRFYQAPVSWRILPRVLGQAHRAVAMLEETARNGLRDLASNPTFVPPGKAHPDGHTISTGAYHNAMSPAAFDTVTQSWVDLGELAHRHAVKFHKGEVSLLPERLLPPGTDYLTAASTTYMEYVPNGFLEEMRWLASPTLLSPREPAASEQDDINISGPLGWLKEGRAARLFDKVLAVLALTSSQALHITERKAPPRLAGLLETIREKFPIVTETRELGPDAQALSEEFGRRIETGESGPRLSAAALRVRTPSRRGQKR